MTTYTRLLRSIGTMNAAALGNNGQDAIDSIVISPVANSSANNKLTIRNASFGQATTLTIPDNGSATGSFSITNSAGFSQEKVTNITAGTTQTQAGATAITSGTVVVTTGNANDGVILPALSAALIGTRVQLINSSALAGKIYGAGSNTINGTAGATGVAYAASKTLFLIAVSATNWVSTLSN